MDDLKNTAMKLLEFIVIPLTGGWLVARADFSNIKLQLAIVLAVVVGLFLTAFPWRKMRHGVERERNQTKRALIGGAVAVPLLAILGYEILVRGRWDWFANNAVIFLVVIGELGLLLKRWIGDWK